MGESLLAFSMACLCRSRPEEEASRMDHVPRGKSPDFHSLTLRIKLSMNAVYQLMPSRKVATANSLRGRKAVANPCSGFANAFMAV
jgi:hypothetical protein